MKASDYIALFLEKKGVKFVFELSGGMITHMLDSLAQKSSVKVITMHHEQAAAFAADAYGRITGLPGVAMATSGPGATNLLTGIGNCYFDSSPAIFITGQVNRHEQKGDRNIRQLGFQETDIVAMAKPITKASYLVNDPALLPEILEDAFRIATEGRPGPVLIDIPMDVQRAEIDANPADICLRENVVKRVDLDAVMTALEADIRISKRPLVLAGRGISAAHARQAFREFLTITKLPVITTLLAVDIVGYDDDHRAGYIGSYGNRWANIAFGECGLLIVLGSRLDIRQTGAIASFFEDRKIYHVDCEEGEINNRIQGCVPVVSDVKVFLEQFNSHYSNTAFARPEEWYAHIDELRAQWPDTSELTTVGINPNTFMHILSQASQEAGAYLIDVGAHQMWASQSLEIQKDQLFITSAGMGAMGFALPAAIGATLSLDLKPVVVIIGDGCMQINIQELQTIVRNNLPVKIIVMNNKNLGMIRQFQESYFESRYTSTYWGYSAPDFEKVASAYGIAAITIHEEADAADGAAWIWSDANAGKPALLQVMIDPFTNCYPKIAFGRPITEMEPFAKPLEMEGT